MTFTQYTAEFFWTTKTSAFSTNAQSMFMSVVLDGVLGPPRLARHTWQCLCIYLVPKVTHKTVTGPWCSPRQLKKQFRRPRRSQGSCWKEWKWKVLSQRRVIDLHGGQMALLIFHCLWTPWYLIQSIFLSYVLIWFAYSPLHSNAYILDSVRYYWHFLNSGVLLILGWLGLGWLGLHLLRILCQQGM